MHIVTWTHEIMEGKNKQDLLGAAKADGRDFAGRHWESAPMTRRDYEAPVIVESEAKRLIAG